MRCYTIYNTLCLTVGFGLNNFNSMKYKVIFVQDEKEIVLVDGLSDVQACQYAINLHQSSNVKHFIKVHEDSSLYGALEGCLLTLIKS